MSYLVYVTFSDVKALLCTSRQYRKGKEIQEFQNWGRLFTIEFEITVTTNMTYGWTNVFHVTADGNYKNYGEGCQGYHKEHTYFLCI